MGEAIAFYTLAAFILGFAVLVVTTKDTVHSVLFLVLDFLFVAALYVLLALGAQWLPLRDPMQMGGARPMAGPSWSTRSIRPRSRNLPA